MAQTPKNQTETPRNPRADDLTTQPNRTPRPLSGRPPVGRTPVGRGRLTEREEDIPPLSMSGIRTGLLNSTITKAVLGLLILIFAGTFLLGGLSGNAPKLGTPGNQGARGSGPDPVAQAAGQDIPRAQFEQGWDRQQQFAQMIGQNIGPAELLSARAQALQESVGQAAQIKAAQDAGITVSEAEIDARIDKEISDKIKSEQGENPANFRRGLEAKGQTEQAYRDELRPAFDREIVRRAILVEKLQQSVKDANKVSEADYKKSITKLNLRQIVLRPKLPELGAKDAKASEKAAAEATARAQKIVAQLKPLSAGALSAQFATLASKQSDDAATKTKGGSVGFKTPAELPIPPSLRDALSNATTNLVGPLKDETSPTGDSYIFLIQGRQLALPKDYAKKKTQLLKDFETQRDNDAWSAQAEKIKKAAPVEIYDPALQAFKIQSEQVVGASGADADRLRRDALAKYQEALGFSDEAQAAAIHYQMAQLHQGLKQPTQYIEQLEAAAKSGENTAPIRIELARALRESKKFKEATAQLQQVSKQLSDNPPAASMFGGGGNPADALRFQIAQEYEALSRRDLADAERRKITPPQGAPGGMQGLPPGVSTMPGLGTPSSAAEFGGKAPVPPPPASSRPPTRFAPSRGTGAPSAAKPAAKTPPVTAPARP